MRDEGGMVVLGGENGMVMVDVFRDGGMEG